MPHLVITVVPPSLPFPSGEQLMLTAGPGVGMMPQMAPQQMPQQMPQMYPQQMPQQMPPQMYNGGGFMPQSM